MRSSIFFAVLIIVVPLSARSQERAVSEQDPVFHFGAEVQKVLRYYSVGSYELGLLGALHDTTYLINFYGGLYGVFYNYNYSYYRISPSIDSYSISIEAAPELHLATWLWLEPGAVGRITFQKYKNRTRFDTGLEYGGKLSLNVKPAPALWLQLGIGLLQSNIGEDIGSPLGTINLRFLTTL